MARNVVALADAGSDLNLVGGKAGNLFQLIQAGFDVPGGFCVTADAYRQVVDGAVEDVAREQLTGLDHTDIPALEAATAAVRKALWAAPLPDGLRAELASAYAALGDDVRVAVRSSGSAEDLDGTSFAGLHDTYLDIVGLDDVEAAVRRCWASLWSARATAYRHGNGFDHLSTSLSVVVQTMVESEVSGVAFTVNPRTGHTGEIVINASWGLGESIVSGVVDPDEIVVSARDCSIVSWRVGLKETRIDRAAGSGTIETEVAEADRERRALTDAQVSALADLAGRVQAAYGGQPQDIEWALADGRLWLLQSRPVTGVRLSWDHEVDGWQAAPEKPGTVWTLNKSEEMWNGAKTPLFYSIRASLWQRATDHLGDVWNIDEARGLWFWKYYRGEAYYNTEHQKVSTIAACPPVFRAAELPNVPPTDHAAVLAAPFDLLRYVRGYLSHEASHPERGFFRWMDNAKKSGVATNAAAREALAVDLTQLTDDELIAHIDAIVEVEAAFWHDVWVPFFLYFRDTTSLLVTMIMTWYDGDNPYAVVDIMSGTAGAELSYTMEETHRLWQLAEDLRASDELSGAFGRGTADTYLTELAATPAGAAWVERYRAFVAEYGHRGSTDRDMVFPRRAEDPRLDHQALAALLRAEDREVPEVRQRRLTERRDEVVADVVANLAGKPFGSLRVLAFNAVLKQVLDGLAYREDSRAPTDLTVFATKAGCLEMGSRLVAAGRLAAQDDVYYLARHELYALLRGEPYDDAVLRAKIEQRREDVTAVINGTAVLPRYLRDGQAFHVGDTTGGGDGSVLQGNPTSRGRTRGVAKVVRSLDEIGRIGNGDVLVCPATDPGWTPVFGAISGLVLESGGLLAHGSCLSREYGLPCIQVPGATRVIPDGAVVEIDGDTGVVTILEPSSSAVEA